MRRASLAVIALAVVAARGGAAQFAVEVRIGQARFGGVSQDTTSGTQDKPSGHPYRPTLWGLRVSSEFGRIGAAVTIHYAPASFAVEGDSIAVVFKRQMTLYEITPELTLRLVSTATGATL